MKAILLSAAYDGARQKVVLKFYDPENDRLILWTDKTNHLPYCYTSMDVAHLGNRSDVIKSEKVLIKDVLTDRSRPLTKLSCDTPTAISGIKDSVAPDKIWEADIKYYQHYLHDNNLVVGSWYDLRKSGFTPLVQSGDNEILDALKNSNSKVENDKFTQQMKDWASLLNQDIPKMERLAVDIEVDPDGDRMPDPLVADRPITAIGFHSNKDNRVFLLDDKKREGEPLWDATVFGTETDMLAATFEHMEKYPIVITYNGDEFDLPYLYNRAVKLGIKDIPLYMMKRTATLKRGIHIDLFPLFKNRSLRLYAFNNAYDDLKLDTLAKTLLDESKIEHGKFSEMKLFDLGKYCLHDAKITYDLTSYENDLVMNLLVIIARISKLPIDDVSRVGLSSWAKSLFNWHQVKTGTLIPNRAELDARTVEVKEKAMIDGKKYKGALVMEPKHGVHFDVKVMDFASLYPSIMKNYNVSFETTRCCHIECKDNILPSTEHHMCKKNIGITPLLIGSLMELRVNYYKKSNKPGHGVITQMLKVILNGSYGVMGFESFPYFYLPAAEAVTAMGRHIISETISSAESHGINVLYSDTDSCFLKSPSQEDVDYMVNTTRVKYGISLEVDKEYRYMVLSNRKKNYLGIKPDGKLDVKGLSGKKSNTPMFIKDLFREIGEKLSKVVKEEEFVQVRSEITKTVGAKYKDLESHEIPLESLAFTATLSKDPSEYKVVPQHVKAAQQIDQVIKAGEKVRYVKTIDTVGVKPIGKAVIDDIDIEKYREAMRSTLEQVLGPLDVDFEVAIGMGRQANISEFFG